MGERKLAATGRRSAIVALALASTACATIVNGTSQDLYVETQPEAAACKIDRQGATVGMVNPTLEVFERRGSTSGALSAR